MLGHTYRYQVQNGTGVSVTCTVKCRDFKFASDGSRTDEAETTPISAVSVATATFSNSGTIDNSTTKDLGTDILFSATLGASGGGTVSLFLQRSTDGGATWPANGQGQWLAVISFPAASANGTSVTTVATVR